MEWEMSTETAIEILRNQRGRAYEKFMNLKDDGVMETAIWWLNLARAFDKALTALENQEDE